MPLIRVDILKGRPDEQKKELVERLTETLSDVLGTPPQATWVIVEEHDKENWSTGGVRFSEK